MSKVAMILGRVMPVALCAAVAMGCLEGCSGSGLDQPTVPEPAMQLRVHLTEAPPASSTEISASLAPIYYCPPSNVAGGSTALSPPDSPAFSQPLDLAAASMTVAVAGGGDLRFFGCSFPQTAPLVRFFQPDLFFSPSVAGGGPPIPWTSRDVIVAYATEPVTFTPFGPDDQPISLAAGYSVLRRSCGPAGASWQLQVGAPDAPIDFAAPTSSFYPQPLPRLSALLEQSERALIVDCGRQSPPPVLGQRMSFDRAASLAFSANERQLVFLLPIDPADPAQGAALRAMDLTSGSVSQLAIVPDGRSVQTATTGDIFVRTEVAFAQVQVQSDGSATSRILPRIGFGIVSPDGKWMAYLRSVIDPSPGGSIPETLVRDIASGVERLVEGRGFPVGWSPTSDLVTEEPTAANEAGPTYRISAAATGVPLALVPVPTVGSNQQLAWGTSGPVVLAATTIWTPQQPVARANQVVTFLGRDERDFGLMLQDLSVDGRAAGVVLSPEAGLMTYAASVPGLAFVWARKCLGLFETVCTYDLHRITLPAGADQIVAVADSAAPIAISASHHRLAIAARDGIYLSDLP